VWEPTPKAASVRAVHRALELGVNGFDVAPRYGDGKAEAVLGRALQDRPDPVIVATKVRLSADDLFDVAGAVRRSMDASLRRLRRDAVDSLHFHNLGHGARCVSAKIPFEFPILLTYLYTPMQQAPRILIVLARCLRANVSRDARISSGMPTF